MYTITKKQIKRNESEYGNVYETITREELLELVVDLLKGKVATADIFSEYQYFLSVKDEDCEEE